MTTKSVGIEFTVTEELLADQGKGAGAMLKGIAVDAVRSWAAKHNYSLVPGSVAIRDVTDVDMDRRDRLKAKRLRLYVARGRCVAKP